MRNTSLSIRHGRKKKYIKKKKGSTQIKKKPSAGRKNALNPLSERL